MYVTSILFLAIWSPKLSMFGVVGRREMKGREEEGGESDKVFPSLRFSFADT